jgi:hypothetical protein
MSLLDPGRAARELGFEPGGFDDWLPAVVDGIRGSSPTDDYAIVRAKEIELAG